MILSSRRGDDFSVNSVAIIGGGPAGAMAAERMACREAAGLGRKVRLRVTVFEEKPGWEKPCGGGLSFKALERYPWLLEGSGAGKCVREAEFVAADGGSLRFRLRQPLGVCSRSTLNRLLLGRAARAGAEIIEDRIVDLERMGRGWRLKGRRGAYQSDYVILAAGARSRLRVLLAEDFKARDFMLTFGYYVPVEDDLLRVEFFDDFEGYAWSFPRRDHLSVGICGKAGESRMPELRERLHAFMEKFGYAREGGIVFSHLLPALGVESWSNLPLAGEGWALAGDSAGLVDPVTGEGIYYAMRSGELLAESLLRDSLASYPARVRQEFGGALALGARLAPLFYRGDFFGKSVMTRVIEFAQRSGTFMALLQDLVEGSQGYPGLAARLYRALGSSLLESLASTLHLKKVARRFENPPHPLPLSR
jgi:geranylgeranyl diphosphate/geranylgeranyl-bacteriochlorophyllide a reductase